MRIIIIGCGKVGRTLAQQLSEENHDIVIVDLAATEPASACWKRPVST